MSPPVLLTAQEVAARLRVGTRTVFRWTKNGDLPAPLRLGRRTVRWKADDIDNFLHKVLSTLPARNLDEDDSPSWPRLC